MNMKLSSVAKDELIDDSLAKFVGDSKNIISAERTDLCRLDSNTSILFVLENIPKIHLKALGLV